jgi:membrane protein YdbS with pleckstrin-like domain
MVGMDQRLDPAIRWVWVAGGLASAVPPLVATVVLAIGGWLPGWVTGVAAAVTVLVAVSGVVMPFLRYRNWSYVLRPDDLVIRHGVLTKLERWIPRTRVQYVDVVGGPIERSLGLRSLVVYTAGSGLLSVSVPGLPAADAEALRGQLLAWSTGTGPKQPGAPMGSTEPEEPAGSVEPEDPGFEDGG